MSQTQGDKAKLLLAGLDAAGKTSILRAIDRKMDYIDEVEDLEPTARVEYVTTQFLDTEVTFWDMGGQERYRRLYTSRPHLYFAGTDILVYVIDIQNPDRFDESLEYLSTLVDFFAEGGVEELPTIVAFHKYDPELLDDRAISRRAEELAGRIKERVTPFRVLFQQTSIYDIISITQLISYALSVLNEEFQELHREMLQYGRHYDCPAVVMLDSNGMIISEYFQEDIPSSRYRGITDAFKEHIYRVKRAEREGRDPEFGETRIEGVGISYFHPVNYRGERFYMSLLLVGEGRQPAPGQPSRG
jgi:GTPase SAR1 family protein